MMSVHVSQDVYATYIYCICLGGGGGDGSRVAQSFKK